MFQNQIPVLDKTFARRSDIDFINRSKPGLVVYAFAWLVIIFGTDFFYYHATASWWLSAVLFLISALRYAHVLLTNKMYEKSPGLWMAICRVMVMAHAAFWSTVFVLSIVNPEFSILTIPMIMIATMIGGAAVASMKPKFMLTQSYLAVLLLPAALASFYTPEYRFLAGMIVSYWLYSIAIGLRFYKEYVRTLNIEQELLNKQQELELLSKTDSLTKIYNRHYFEDCFEYQWQLAVRHGTDMALLMIDIDHFKSINDKHGHVFGDECLVHAAEVIRNSAKRNTDMVVRYGGEEFVLILPDTKQEAAVKLAELIRHNIEQSEFEYAGKHQKVTASIGVSVMQPKQYSSPTVLLQKADQALYHAKSNGRNCVELGE
jgi:diguanylate cyclase (GGDEF)-like protein